MYGFILCVSGIIIFTVMIISKHFGKSLMLSLFHGMTALFAVNFIGDFIGVHLALNWFSICVSAAGGLPGVVFLLLSDIISKVYY